MLYAIFESETELLYPVRALRKKKKKKYRGTKTYTISRSYGELSFHVLETEDFSITFHNYKIKKDFILQIREDGDRPLLYSTFRTPVQFSIDGGDGILVGPFEFSLMHAPGSTFSLPLEKKLKYRFCTIRFTKQFMLEFLPLFQTIVPFYVKAATGQPFYFPMLHHHPLKKSMLAELEKVRDCTFKKKLKSVYVNTILRSFFIDAFDRLSRREAKIPLPPESKTI